MKIQAHLAAAAINSNPIIVRLSTTPEGGSESMIPASCLVAGDMYRPDRMNRP